MIQSIMPVSTASKKRNVSLVGTELLTDSLVAGRITEIPDAFVIFFVGVMYSNKKYVLSGTRHKMCAQTYRTALHMLGRLLDKIKNKKI